MSTIDITITNVALPTIGKELNASPSALSQVSTSYLVAIACVLGTTAWLDRRFGSKAVLLSTIAVFTAASVLCGLAWSLPVLIIARVLQGIGGGVIGPVGLAMLYRAYPTAERVRITASTALVTGFAPILGPAVGGLLVSTASWRLVFFVNVPIGIFAIVYGLIKLPALARGQETHPLDVRGLILSVLGLGALVFGFSFGADTGWQNPFAAVAVVGGAALLAVFTIQALRSPAPLLKMSLLKSRFFGSAALTTFLGNGAFFGGLYVVALYLQRRLGLSPLEAGLLMLAEAIPVIAGAQLVSRVLMGKFSAQKIAITGLSGLTLTQVLMAVFSETATVPVFAVLLFLLGLAWSMVFIPVSITAFERIDHADTAHASTLLSSMRQIASAVGIAIASTALVIGVSGSSSYYWIAFAFLAIISAGSVAAAIWMHRVGDPQLATPVSSTNI